MTVYLAQPVHRALAIRTAASIQRVLASPVEAIQWVPYWGDASITRARSVQATWFYDESQADVLVFVDDDIVFEPSSFWRIVELARLTNGIACGAYVTHGDNNHLALREWPGTETVRVGSGGPVWVEYASTGFMAVHRSVFERLFRGEYEDADGKHRLHRCGRGAENAEMIPFFDTMTIEEAPGVFHWLSEDWAFCERANQLGIQVWVDPTIRLGHMSYLEQTARDMVSPVQGAQKIEVTIPQTGDWLIDTLPNDLAEYTGQSLNEVIGAMYGGAELLAQMWKAWEGTEEEFYRNPQVGAAYALDLGWWHLNGGGVPAERFTGQKTVLDYGAGVGTAALMAARMGSEVTACEINPWLREFIQWRARKLNLQVRVADATLPPETFHAVVCWHVFEHVEHPEVLLADLLAHLHPGGELIHDADFHIDEQHPMHHELDYDWAEHVEKTLVGA